MKPGVHNLPAGDYYSDQVADDEPSLNGTVLKVLLGSSPLHAWTAHPKLNPDYEEKTSTTFDVGTVAHAVFLQGEQITTEDVVFEVDGGDVYGAVQINLDGRPFALVTDAKDWRTKIAQAVQTHARDLGLTPLLKKQWPRVQEMVAAMRRQLPGIDTGAEPALFTAGKAEQTLVWRDRGVLCRARLDWLHDSRECADDVKTTAMTANPHVWSRRTFTDIGADIQAAFTLRGLRAACGVESTFRFLLAETSAPFAISAVRPSPQALAFANQRIDVGLDRWKRCLAEDRWPSYPPVVLNIDPPAWAEGQWAEMRQLEDELPEQAEMAA